MTSSESQREVAVDVVIFGGGAAGLWLLDDLVRGGYTAVLLEAHALGSGQTVASQGIIHGGTKYSFSGTVNASARAIRDMPELWRQCLAGKATPDLSNTRVRAEFGYVWQTTGLRSRLGMLGVKKALTTAPVEIDRADWPAPLNSCPGHVLRLDEQVVSPDSFIADLAQQHTHRLVKFTSADLAFEVVDGSVTTIRLGDAVPALRPTCVVLAAGAGNAALRQQIGLPGEKMQRRPLHMTLLRGGSLVPLNGHCADGARTRVTITADEDRAGRVVWQVGGQVAEEGVAMDESASIAHTRDELLACIPRLDLADVEWSTYRVDRAEHATAGGRRPDSPFAERDGNVITGWPTKLVLAPVLSRMIQEKLDGPSGATSTQEIDAALASAPRPDVADPPWETRERWYDDL